MHLNVKIISHFLPTLKELAVGGFLNYIHPDPWYLRDNPDTNFSCLHLQLIISEEN